MKKTAPWPLCFLLCATLAVLAQDDKTPDAATTAAEATKEHPFVNSLGMKFVPVPVTGTKVLFSIWDTRVQDYFAYAEASPGVDMSWTNPGFKQGENDPVVKVNWNDANAFCAWLTAKERKEGMIGANDMYRLPKDHEWSCAVGIGDREGPYTRPWAIPLKNDGIYPWGKQWPPPKGAANLDSSLKVDDFDHTSPVGSFEANPCGLYDMAGNVSQWCWDLYDPGEKFRMLRGTSWIDDDPTFLLSAYRTAGDPEKRSDVIGFRCVLVIAPTATPAPQLQP